MKASLVIALFAAATASAACGVRLDDGNNNIGGGDGDGDGDGGGGGGGADSGVPDASTPDAPAACANGRVVYLNFTGQALTRGMTSDATLNRASWMTDPSGAAPRYRSGDNDRDAKILAITTAVRQQLSSFPVTVVTTRPATGPYVMIVYGGNADDVQSRYGAAVNELDCGDVNKSDVAWISDAFESAQAVANTSIGAIGFGLGLTATEDPLGCMCGWANDCNDNDTQACKLSTSIARDPDATQRCQGLITQNEVATFDAAFCQ